MTDRPHRGPVDYERLGEHLRILGVPTRVLLLHKLQVPQTSAEVHLPPFRKARDKRHDRPVSRQTVESHLQKLEAAGLVRARAATRDGQPVREYLVNQPRVFTMVDDLRRLALIRPASSVAGPGTPTAQGPHTEEAEAGPAAAPELPSGPSLVLVSGPYESRAFPLDGSGPWTIGRSKDADVALDYDPFVSANNTEVARDGKGFLMRDLATSRNGTTRNWHLLDKGVRAALRSGDTVGVGRSLLVFRAP